MSPFERMENEWAQFHTSMVLSTQVSRRVIEERTMEEANEL